MIRCIKCGNRIEYGVICPGCGQSQNSFEGVFLFPIFNEYRYVLLIHVNKENNARIEEQYADDLDFSFFNINDKEMFASEDEREENVLTRDKLFFNILDI